MGVAFCEISVPRVRIDSKIIREEGMDTVSNAATGKVVSFSKPFVDIRSLTVTAAYNASYPTQAVYDFTDIPNPTDFTVYIYRTDTQAKVTGDFSWAASGV